MRKLIAIVVLLFVMTACVPAPNNPETQLVAESTEFQPLPSAITTEKSLATAILVPTKEGDALTFAEYTSGNLWLHLFSPKDGDIVAQPVVNVTGEVPAETVISLNETISLITDEGLFSLPVTLEKGPNVIEVVASNLDGDEISFVLMIVYEE
jgi:hypothetical protein